MSTKPPSTVTPSIFASQRIDIQARLPSHAYLLLQLDSTSNYTVIFLSWNIIMIIRAENKTQPKQFVWHS